MSCHEIHLEEDRHGVNMAHHVLHLVRPGGMTETFRGMGRQIMTTDTKIIEATTVALAMNRMTENVMINSIVVESHHVDMPKMIISGHLIEVTE